MFIKVNGIRIYYEVQGTGSPLILVHGNEENHFIFDNAVEILKKHYTCYLIDSRGHGQSDSVKEYHYLDMANDIYEIIQALHLKDISFVGSSDGAIIGILLASKHQDLFKNLVLCGANTKPNGVVKEAIDYMKADYKKRKHPLVKLMLEEPHIKASELENIKCYTLVIAGSDDLIKESHTRYIQSHIPNSKLLILENETHGSYVNHSDKIAKIILKEL